MSIAIDEVRKLMLEYQAPTSSPYPRCCLFKLKNFKDSHVDLLFNNFANIYTKLGPILTQSWNTDNNLKILIDYASEFNNLSFTDGKPDRTKGPFIYWSLKQADNLEESTPVYLKKLFLECIRYTPAGGNPLKSLILYRKNSELNGQIRRNLDTAMTGSACFEAIQDFDGTDPNYDVEDFLAAVERAAEAGSWESPAKCSYAHLKLRGAARQWLKSDPDLPLLKNWDIVKTRLRQRFQPKNSISELFRLFQSCMQAPTETAASYGNRLQCLAQRVNIARGTPTSETERILRRKFLEEDICAQFLTGLKPELARFVRVRAAALPELGDIQTLIDAAADEELSEIAEQIGH